MNTDYVAFDPGGTTGFAYFGGGRYIVGSFDHFTQIDDLVKPGRVVIYERPFKTMGVDPIVFRVEGAILERIHKNKCEYYPQSAGIPQYMSLRYQIELATLYHSYGIKVIHTKEALCHLIYWLLHHTDYNPWVGPK